MTETAQLLNDYVRNGSESAFRELVNRYVGLIYGTALRYLDGDVQSAEDITQTVFLHLAQHAARLGHEPLLGGWLHRDACREAGKLLRSDRRRLAREQQAVLMNSLDDHSEAATKAIAPILDDAIDRLDPKDRSAILMRFFEQRDFRSLGQQLGSNEDAARMRVHRALEKLHGLLLRRGVTLSAVGLVTALQAKSLTAAPAGLAATVAASVLSSAAASAVTTSTLLKIMTITKLKAGLAGAIVIGGVTASILIQSRAEARHREQDTLLQTQANRIALLETENARLENAPPQPPPDLRAELDTLRAEIDSLRKKVAALPGLRAENLSFQSRARASRSPAQPTVFEAREQAMAKLGFGRQYSIAFILYAEDNDGQLAPDFESVKPFLGEVSQEVADVSPDDFELVCSGKLKDVRKPAETILIREKQAYSTPNGGWAKAYAFADGHCEIHTEADGNFDKFEKARLQSPPAQ